jgi:uncharacterized protein YcsI (UPF0317 family)
VDAANARSAADIRSLLSPKAVRTAIRSGQYAGQTAGLARGLVQGNVVILPSGWAGEFLRYCVANPKPCSVLAIGKPGSPFLPLLGDDIDIRSDVPRYRVFRNGAEVETPTNIAHLWRDDFVAFVLGCSFTFEQALLDAGLRLRHVEANRNVSMYVTNVQTVATERFKGPMVVSMRTFKPKDAITAVQITSRFPTMHGAPIHIGLPEAIGIDDLTQPDFGEAPILHADELPVFWACGVTPQLAIAAARPPISITHFPGHMLITDVRNLDLASF